MKIESEKFAGENDCQRECVFGSEAFLNLGFDGIVCAGLMALFWFWEKNAVGIR